MRLAGVLGLRVRHATFISEELAATGVVETLVEALRDKNERVRRRVAATLGELLFYVATQQQDSGAGSVVAVAGAWGIGAPTAAGVARLLRVSSMSAPHCSTGEARPLARRIRARRRASSSSMWKGLVR